MTIIIAYIYISAVVLLIKSEVIKQQIALIKITDVQKKIKEEQEEEEQKEKEEKKEENPKEENQEENKDEKESKENKEGTVNSEPDGSEI